MTTDDEDLVGRSSERGAVAHVLDRALEREAGFILLLGEAGIGKTRLLRAIAADARSRGLRVLPGTAIESGSGLPFLPLIAALATATAPGQAAGPAAARVRGLVDGVAATDPSDAGAAARLIEAIHDVLISAPTALLVDDVQWADGSTLAVLDYLAHRARDVPLAVVLAARDDERAVIRGLSIADGRQYRPLPIGRLSPSDVAEQLAALLGRPPDPRTLERIVERSAGNPFFVEQLVADGDDVVPTSLRLLVGRRIARVDRDTRSVLEAIAVIGRPADDDLVAQVAAAPLDVVGTASQAAIAAGIATRVGTGTDLRHPLFREVVLADLGASSADRLHRRAAEALEAGHGSLAEIAGHWWQTDDRRRAWQFALDAGLAAEAALAFPEAYLHMDRALHAWPADPSPGTPSREEIAVRASNAASVSGNATAALRIVREALDRGENSIDLLTANGMYEWDAGGRVASAAAFERVSGLLTEATPADLRARAVWGLGRARVGEGRFDEAAMFARQSASISAEIGDDQQEAEAWMLYAMARAWVGSLDGLDRLDRAVELAVRAGEPSTTGLSHQFLVDVLTLGGYLDRALEVSLRGIELSDRLGVAGFHGSDLRGRAAMLLIELGRWDEAKVTLEPADPRAFPSLARALLAVRRGLADDARVEVQAAAGGGAIGGPGALGGWLELVSTEAAWTAGDSSAAIAAMTPGPTTFGAWALDVDARAAVWRARLAPDPDLLAERISIAERANDVPLARALVAEIRAEAAIDAMGDAPAAWATAVAAWAEAGRPYERALALLREAAARFAAGDRDRARARVQEVAAFADEIGAAPLAGMVEDLARRARVTSRPARRHTPDPAALTARELEVLRLLADGLTNLGIAEHLFLSRKTVGIHVSRILDKLDARTRGEAVAIGRRGGLLD